MQIPIPQQGDLIVELHRFRSQRAVLPLPQCLVRRHAVQGFQQVGQRRREIHRLVRQRLAEIQHPAGAAAGQRLDQGSGFVPSRQAEHGGHIFAAQRPLAVGDGLVGDGKRIPHAASGRLGDDVQRLGIEVQPFVRQHALQIAGDFLPGNVAQLKLQAAGQHGDRHLARVRGGEQKLDVRRRLLQGFQEGIEAGGGEHVNFVDEIYLVAPPGRQVLGVVQEFPGVVHPGAGGGVHLQQIDEAVLLNLPADGAISAGLGRHPGLAVQAFGQNAGDAGLAHAASAGEHVGMMHPPGIQPVAQRAHHMLLPHQAGETLGAQLSGQHLIAHWRYSSLDIASRAAMFAPDFRP